MEQRKDLSFVPLRPERVVEVRYDYMEGIRFRHTAQFERWRPDRDPHTCTYDQLNAGAVQPRRGADHPLTVWPRRDQATFAPATNRRVEMSK